MKPRNRIFLDEKISTGKIIIIKDKQAHYLINVLRCKINEKILIFNKGEWLAEIVNIRSKAIELSVEKKNKRPSKAAANKALLFTFKKKSKRNFNTKMY